MYITTITIIWYIVQRKKQILKQSWFGKIRFSFRGETIVSRSAAFYIMGRDSSVICQPHQSKIITQAKTIHRNNKAIRFIYSQCA